MYDLFISLTFFFSGNTVFLSFVFIVLKYIFFIVLVSVLESFL